MAPIQQDLYKGGQWTFDHYCFSMISAAATRWVLDQVKCVLQDVLVLSLPEGDYLWRRSNGASLLQEKRDKR